MLDCRAYLASAYIILVVLGGLWDCWVVMFGPRAYFASV